MDEKTKQMLKFGLVFAGVAILLEIVLLAICSNDLFCLGLNLVLLAPGLLISNAVGAGPNTSINIFGNLVFYFILGGIIGLVIYKIKNK